MERNRRSSALIAKPVGRDLPLRNQHTAWGLWPADLSCSRGMTSRLGSRPTHPLLGLGLVSLLVGVFYVGATLPPSEPPHQADEHRSMLESVALGDLDDLDALDQADSNTGVRPGQDTGFEELLRIIEEDKERFPGPCYPGYGPDAPLD